MYAIDSSIFPAYGKVFWKGYDNKDNSLCMCVF